MGDELKALAPAPETAQAGRGEIREDCPCPKKGCPNYRNCQPCRARHGAKGGKPRCER